MARPALSASRSIDVLDFLAAFPGRSFTLSEIAKAAKINVASCHAVLSALVTQGYLSRGPNQRTYVLGPALVAVGHAAMQSQPLIVRAREAAIELVRDYDIPVLLSTVVCEEILCVVSIPDSVGGEAGMSVGERMPFVPPVGAAFLAWSQDDSAIEQWIARHSGPVSDRQTADWLSTLELMRRRGYQVTLRAQQSSAIADVMAELATGRRIPSYKDEVTRLINSFDSEMQQPEAIEPDTLYDIVLIAAPIFDQSGQVAFSLCLGGFRERLKGARIVELADRLVRTCLRLVREDRGQS